MARTRRADNVIDMPSPSLDADSLDRSAIARRAYELYELRGRTDGADLNDWLRAEQELRQGDALKAS